MSLYNSNKSTSKYLERKMLFVYALFVLVILSVIFYVATNKERETKAELAAMDKLEELEAAAKIKDEAPLVLKKEASENTRFEKNYFQIEQELMTKIKGSNKVMVVQLAIMTHYDTRVFDNFKKHEFALRSAMIDIMSQSTETETNNPNFRKELAVKLKDVMNSMLEEYENFGGVDEVMFTSFALH